MRTFLLIYISMLFLTSCIDSITPIEESEKKVDNLESSKDSIVTRSYYDNDTLRYPPVSFTIRDIDKNRVKIEVPNLFEYTINDKGLHPEYPTYSWTLGQSCYIQYRETRNDRNWYYYHPDTIKSTTPYEIKVLHFHPEATGAYVDLDATKFPMASFEYRGKLLGEKKTSLVNGKVILNETEWQDEDRLTMPWGYNPYGFIYGNKDDPDNQHPTINIRLQIRLYVTLRLKAEQHSGGYMLSYGRESVIFKVPSNRVEYFSHTFVEEKTVYNVTQNSVQHEEVKFNGRTYYITYYVSSYRDIYYADYEIYIEATAQPHLY